MANPAFAQRIGSDISTAEQGLQDEANKYVQGASANQNLGDDIYGKALTGDQSAFQGIQGLLGRKADAEAQAYKSFAPETNTSNSDVESLRNSAGLGDLLRKEAGPALTQRELDLDRSVLERSPEFINIKNQLIGRQGALQNTAAGLQTSKTDEARKAYQASIQAAQEAAKGGLGSQQSGLQAELDRRAAEENAAREALRGGGGADYIAQQKQAAMDALGNDLTDPQGAKKYLAEALKGVDVNQFYNVGANVGGNDLMNQDEAGKFNIINQLLGTGKIAQAGAGPGERQGFKGGDFYDAVKHAASQKDLEANKSAQAQMDKLLGEAKSKAANENALRASLKSGAMDTSSFYAPMQAVRDELAKKYGGAGTQNVFNEAGSNYIDPHQFASVAGDVNYADFIGNDQASQLNDALNELSQTDAPRYSAGTFNQDRGSFNSDAYRQALLGILNAPKPSKPQTPSNPVGTAGPLFGGTGPGTPIGNGLGSLGTALDKSAGSPVAKYKGGKTTQDKLNEELLKPVAQLPAPVKNNPGVSGTVNKAKKKLGF